MNSPAFSHSLSHRRHGFTLIEMIGVLAIIAILAVVIVPRVFQTIASSRVTNAVASINSAKAAVTEFAARYGTIPYTNGNARLDDLLLKAGMLETRFEVPIGNKPANPPAAARWVETNGVWTANGGSSQGSISRLICRPARSGTPSTTYGANFRLDGSTDLPTGARVVSAVLVNITAREAQELSDKIDGEALTPDSLNAADELGRVVYRAPNGAGLTTAWVYIAHQ
ncbi:MAG: prepilin-type N-terminal cleavage/methylation domain-containing protein [Verrucomicrobia bacterium]|nr:MAG: prepilin-type N-terminal cleavage/methylation domain-containing protein [Verrucomicrobiota bacterium]